MKKKYSKKEKKAFAIGCRVGMNNAKVNKNSKRKKTLNSKDSYISSIRRKMSVGKGLSFREQMFIENNSHLFD